MKGSLWATGGPKGDRMSRAPHKRPSGQPPIWRFPFNIIGTIFGLWMFMTIGGALTDDIPTVGEVRDGMRFLATRTLPAATVAAPAPVTISLPPSTLTLATPLTTPVSPPEEAPAPVVVEPREEVTHVPADSAPSTGSNVTEVGEAELPDVTPAETIREAVPSPTIRDLLDARFAAYPAQDSEAFVAFATAVAAEYRRDRLIHTFVNKWSPIFATLPPAIVANRYWQREAWDAVALSVGWQPEELEQLWRIARYEAPSEIVDDQGVGGPPGLVDMLAVGPGDEVCAAQISALYFDVDTAVYHDFPLLFADFQLFDVRDCLLAARFLYENGGWGHWQAWVVNKNGQVRVEETE